MAHHSFRVWSDTGEELEGFDRLENSHAATLGYDTTAALRERDQLGHQGEVDHVGEPQ